MIYQEIKGDLIKLAQQGQFDVVAHGCNCFCRMKRGIAPQMAAAFKCDKFLFESIGYEGDVNKLGNIDYKRVALDARLSPKKSYLIVMNAYTQYHWDSQSKPFDYDAFTLCMRKINHRFKGDRIGLPQIGAGLAGGDWERIKTIIQNELKDCQVTVVIYEP